MTQQYVPNLGETPTEDARRDAVHVAVAPVIAARTLQPGWHVGLDENGQAYSPTCDRRTEETVGIVDPFLDHWVDKGERFWLWLYPNTVTSLRHCWTHPSFVPRLPEKPRESQLPVNEEAYDR